MLEMFLLGLVRYPQIFSVPELLLPPGWTRAPHLHIPSSQSVCGRRPGGEVASVLLSTGSFYKEQMIDCAALWKHPIKYLTL